MSHRFSLVFPRAEACYSTGKSRTIPSNIPEELGKLSFIVWMIAFAAQPAWGLTVSGFSPTFGSVGDPIVVSGSGFSTGTPTVKFNGTTANNPYVAADDTIDVNVPTGATSGLISVTIGSDTQYSSQSFTVIGAGPYITSFSPAVGSSGTTVYIEGVHFTSATAVRFNGTNASSFFIAADTEIQAVAPSSVTTGPITVASSLGTNTTTTNFFVPPAITAFSPVTGRPGTNVVITGKNFIGTTALLFNGTSAAFTVSNNAQMLAIVPTNAVTGVITLTAPAGTYQTSTNFRMLPNITSFSPTNGSVGTNITINGANLNEGTSSVKIGGVSATINGSPTFSQIVAVVQSGTTNGPISVTTSNGTVTTASLFYMPPRITSFTPNNSAPGSRITITGVNFLGATAVSFNGTPASSFNVTNNTTIGATVPAGLITGPISVTTPGGTTNSTPYFYGAPVIQSFSPTHGLPGTNVTIFGTNFIDASAVWFNGSNATFSIVNNGKIQATVPTNATTGPIAVVAPGGTNTSADSFTLDYSSDIGVTVTDSPDPVAFGSNLVYSIVITNKGPLDAPGVMLTNTLPAPVILKSATTTRGSLNTNGNPIIGNLGQLSLGAFAIVTLTVVPQSSGTIVNQTAAGSLYPDPDLSNNAVTTMTFVQPRPLLSIQQIASLLVQISWPVALSNYSLQYNTNLVASTSWSNVTTVLTIVDTNNVVTESADGAMKFYRLKSQP